MMTLVLLIPLEIVFCFANDCRVAFDNGVLGELANGSAFPVVLIALSVDWIERFGMFGRAFGTAFFRPARGRTDRRAVDVVHRSFFRFAVTSKRRSAGLFVVQILQTMLAISIHHFRVSEQSPDTLSEFFASSSSLNGVSEFSGLGSLNCTPRMIR